MMWKIYNLYIFLLNIVNTEEVKKLHINNWYNFRDSHEVEVGQYSVQIQELEQQLGEMKQKYKKEKAKRKSLKTELKEQGEEIENLRRKEDFLIKVNTFHYQAINAHPLCNISSSCMI